MTPKLTDAPPRVDPATHAPTVLDAFANMVTRMRAEIAAHPDWTPEQIRARVASFPDTVEPPAPPMSPAQLLESAERARSAAGSSYDRFPEGEAPCCPRERSWSAPPCDCQRLYR